MGSKRKQKWTAPALVAASALVASALTASPETVFVREQAGAIWQDGLYR